MHSLVKHMTKVYATCGRDFLSELPGGDLPERTVDIDVGDDVPCAAFRADRGPGVITHRWMTLQLSKRLDPHRTSVCVP